MGPKHILRLAVISIAAVFVCLPVTAQDPAAQKAEYQAMVDKVKGGKLVDFGKMREAFTKTSDYSGYDDGSKKEMLAALRDKKYKEAYALAEKRLDKVFVDLNAHYVAYVASNELANKEKVDFHREVFVGLVKSITDGRDGLSTKTAFPVISISEEKMVIVYLGYAEAGKQALIKEEGQNFDALTVKDPATKKEFQLFFNIDRFYGKLF